MFLALLLHLLLPLSPLAHSWFFNGRLEIFEPEALTSSFYLASSCRPHLYPAIQSQLIFLFIDPWKLSSASWSHFRSSILFPDDVHASSCVMILVKQGLSFSKLSTSSLSSLDPYYVWVNTLLNNSSSLFFRNVYATPVCSRRIAELTAFLPPFFPPPENSSFWEISIAINPVGTQKLLLTHAGRKYLIRSSL